MTKEEFFAWCDAMELRTNSAIATVLSVSSQTIRNWRKAGAKVPSWISLACAGYEAHRDNVDGPVPRLPDMTSYWFVAWQRRNALRTYEDTGAAFGLSRQAVHNWFRRNKFPNWVPLACIGYECRRSALRTA